MGRLDLPDPDRNEDLSFADPPLLSPRQLQVLRCAALGLSADASAAELGMAPETVKSHRRLAIAKLAARNTTHAIAMAAAAGVLFEGDQAGEVVGRHLTEGWTVALRRWRLGNRNVVDLAKVKWICVNCASLLPVDGPPASECSSCGGTRFVPRRGR